MPVNEAHMNRLRNELAIADTAKIARILSRIENNTSGTKSANDVIKEKYTNYCIYKTTNLSVAYHL